MLNVACPWCGKRFPVKDELAGKKGKCPDCGDPFTFTEATKEEPPPTPQVTATSPVAAPPSAPAPREMERAKPDLSPAAASSPRDERRPPGAHRSQPAQKNSNRALLLGLGIPAGLLLVGAAAAGTYLLLAKVSDQTVAEKHLAVEGNGGSMRVAEAAGAGKDTPRAVTREPGKDQPEGNLPAGNDLGKTPVPADPVPKPDLPPAEPKKAPTPPKPGRKPKAPAPLPGTGGQWPKIVSLPAGKRLAVLEERQFGNKDRVFCLALRPDGKLLAAYGYRIHLWDLSYDPPREWTNLKLDSPVRSMAFSPDGQLLAAGTADGAVRLWDLTEARPREKGVLKAHTKSANTVAFSPDGKALASGSDDMAVILWDLGADPPREKGALRADDKISQAIKSLAFSADGKRLVASGHGSWHLWDLAQMKVVQAGMFKLKTEELPVAYSPDGKTLALAVGNIIRLRSDQAGPLLQGHSDRVTSLGYSRDGALLASTGEDGRLLFWDFPGPKKRMVLDEQGGKLTSMAFAASPAEARLGADQYLVCGNPVGNIHVLHLGYRPEDAVAEPTTAPPMAEDLAKEEEAAGKLRLAQRLLADSQEERTKQNVKLADQLQQKARDGFQKLIQTHPHTKAAEEAKKIVDSWKE